jgi:hypothetical protein
MNSKLLLLAMATGLLAVSGIAAADPIVDIQQCVNVTGAASALLAFVTDGSPDGTDIIAEPGVLVDALLTCP